MTAAATVTFAGVCERCDRPYRATWFPNHGLCASCVSAGATPVAGQVSGS